MNTVLFIWSMSGLAWLITSEIVIKIRSDSKGYTSDDKICVYFYYLILYFFIGLTINSLS